MEWNIVCFDLDNTLFDYEKAFKRTSLFCAKLCFQRWNISFNHSYEEWFEVFKKYCDWHWPGYERGRLTRVQYRRARFQDTMKEFSLHINTRLADEFHSLFDQSVFYFVEPFEGIIPLLHRLKKLPVCLGIITNGNEHIQLRKIKYLSLKPFFSNKNIIISGNVGFHKPSQEIFHLARRRFGQGKAIYIGDSWEQDVIGPLNAGWDAIYFNSRGEVFRNDDRVTAVCETVKDLEMVLFP
jgi:5'-nucleotidase